VRRRGCPVKITAAASTILRLRREAKMLVLPDRIELSTSPLPRECSTTELRQHAGLASTRLASTRLARNQPARFGQMAATKRGGSCHKVPAHASAGRPSSGERNHGREQKSTQTGVFRVRSGHCGLFFFPSKRSEGCGVSQPRDGLARLSPARGGIRVPLDAPVPLRPRRVALPILAGDVRNDRIYALNGPLRIWHQMSVGANRAAGPDDR
jgi:hypothetical protein